VRAVADTNVYISALNFGGTAEEVLTLARVRTLELFTSPSILEEVEGVLIRKFDWSARRAREAVELIRDFARVIHPESRVQVVTEDEPDNRILECALAAKAEVILSADTHLRALQVFQGIPIMRPREFLERHRPLG
jgi:putative PIN family toxin of toxin-antitoxin system